MRRTGTAIALALAVASPALADLTADDVWQGWGAALAQLGAVQTGTVTRDGGVLTVRDAGIAIDLPQGRVAWSISTLILAEDGTGGVTLSFPRAAPVSLTALLPLPGPNPAMTLSAEITAEGLDWRYGGTPEDMEGNFTAERLTIEMTGIEGKGLADLPFSPISGFLVAEDVTRSVRVRDGAMPRVDGETRIARHVSDLSGEGASRLVWRSAEYHDLDSGFGILLPDRPLAAPALSPFLRAGARLELRGSVGETHIRTLRREGEQTLQDDLQEMRDAGWSLALTGRHGLDLVLGNGGVRQSRSGETVLSIAGFDLNLRQPLIARRSVQEARFVLGLDSLRLGGEWRDRIGLPADLPTDPANLELALRAEMILTDDLVTAGGRSGAVERGTMPLDLRRVDLETLSLSWAGAEVTGSGYLFWPGGSTFGPDIQAPEGEVMTEITGAYALLGRLARAGALSPAVTMSLRGGLALFGTPVGPDRIEAHLGFGPDGLRVNGMGLPF